MRLIAIVVLIVILLPGIPGQASGDDGDQSFKIALRPAVVFKGDRGWSLHERMKHYGVPGVGIALVKGHKVAWVKTYGLADRVSGASANGNTLFQAGSISKPVAAFGALQMVEAGQLDLDQGVNQALKSWKLPENEFTAGKDVTLRQLLSHTGGLTVHGFWGYPAGEPVPTLQQVLNGSGPANSEPVRVDQAPGEGFRYSGGGYSIAQQMMIDASGKTFPDLMQEILLGPANMKQSTFEQPLPPEKLNLAAAGVLPNGTDVPGKRHTYPEMAAAGLWTTAGDLALFVVQLQNALRGFSELMSRDMAWTMVTPVDSGYALGLGVIERGGMGYFSHGGWDEGFSARMMGSLERGYGVVVMINSNHPEFIEEVIRGIGFAYGWAGYEVQEKLEIPGEILERAPGRYRYSGVTAVNVYRENGRLFMRYTGETQEELFYVGDQKFMRRERETPVRFNGEAANRSFNFVVDSDDQPPRPLLPEGERLPGEMLEDGSFKEALAAFRAALKDHPEDPSFSEESINSNGQNQLLGNIDYGTALLRINSRLYPDSANTWDSLGYAYKLAGQKDKAIDAYKAALERDPEFRNARAALKDLTEN